MDAGDGKTLGELQAEHAIPPSGPPGEAGEQSGLRNYVRDLILGLNDGIVSVYALCAGVAGAAFLPRSVAVAGIAATVAGALSMGLGEYLSTKSQSQYYASEAQRERAHIRKYPELEMRELREILEAKRYPPDVVDRLVAHLSQDETRFVDFMMREEFGVGKESDRSPVAAMFLIAAAFLVGAAFPVVPYFLAGDTAELQSALYLSTALSLGALFIAGAVKGRISGLSPWRSGAEMALLGGLAAVVTYAAGSLFDAWV